MTFGTRPLRICRGGGGGTRSPPVKSSCQTIRTIRVYTVQYSRNNCSEREKIPRWLWWNTRVATRGKSPDDSRIKNLKIWSSEKKISRVKSCANRWISFLRMWHRMIIFIGVQPSSCEQAESISGQYCRKWFAAFLLTCYRSSSCWFFNFSSALLYSVAKSKDPLICQICALNL